MSKLMDLEKFAFDRFKKLRATKLVKNILLLHLLLFSTHKTHVRSVTLARRDTLTTEFHTMEGHSTTHSAAIAMNITWYRQLMAETRNQPWRNSATLQTIFRYNKQNKV